MKKLPLGIQNLSEIINEDYAYVDKTPFVKQLVDTGKYYFISRPRRFGKSLFVDTLKEAFEGNRDLFKGLYLENNWDWSRKHPVIVISFADGVLKSRRELDRRILKILSANEASLGVSCIDRDDVTSYFISLITEASKKYHQKTVILVDEYDKPILDNITDTETVEEIRTGLNNLYSVIKGQDAHIRFAFLTGVSKFSKVSLFSGLNNLIDITIDEPYSDICGYTQNDLETVFKEHIQGLDMDLLKRWYNGYSWTGENVYNPFGMLNVFRTRQIRNYWFETATPSFLIKLLKQKRYPSFAIDEVRATETILGSFDVENIAPEALMFQSGYLTIKERVKLGMITQYVLGYPNMEVKSALNDHLLSLFIEQTSDREAAKAPLCTALMNGDPDLIHNTFKSLFASIPHDWYRKNNIDAYEGYYASVLFSYFASLGMDMKAEDTTNKGNIDLMVKSENNVFLFEFKMAERASPTPLEQIRQKGYHEKYRGPNTNIFLIGIVFSEAERNIAGFAWEKLNEP